MESLGFLALKVKLQTLLSHSLTAEPLKEIYELSKHIINYLFLMIIKIFNSA